MKEEVVQVPEESLNNQIEENFINSLNDDNYIDLNTKEKEINEIFSLSNTIYNEINILDMEN